MTLRSAGARILRKWPRVRRLLKNAIRVVLREPAITYQAISGDEIRTLVNKDDPIILDIGCNDGAHTLWFLDLFRNARVYSFEPDPRARARYLVRVCDPRATLIDVAVASQDGATDFYMSTGHEIAAVSAHDWDLSGSIRKPKKHLALVPWCKFEQTIKVPTRSLDSWSDEQRLSVIDFIWADVQGSEADLIAGGSRTLNRTRYFYTEYSNTELYEGQVKLKELLRSLPNFDVVRRYEYDVLMKNRALD